MQAHKRLGALGALLLVALAAESARAQTMTLSNTSRGVVWPSSHALPHVDWINRQDCINNPRIAFNIGLGSMPQGFSGYEIEAWIGTSCDTPAARSSTSTQCRFVGKANINDRVVYINVQDLLVPLTAASIGTGGTGGTAGLDSSGGTFGASGTGGVAGTFSSFAEVAGTTNTSGTAGDTSATGGTSATTTATVPSVCEGDSSLPTFSTRTVFFMALNDQGMNAPVGNGWLVKWPFKYDLVGPAAPTGVTAGIGENALVLKWTEASGVATDIHTYNFLCDPPPGATTSSVGAAGAAGADGSTETDPTACDSFAFQEGDIGTQALIDKYGCGSVQKTAATGQANHLTNFQHYAVGIVAEDNFNNFGPISALACASPEPVTDFFEAYRAAGGRGGGGFCSIGRHSEHLVTALLMGGALGLFARRRARRRSGAQGQSQ